MQQDQFQPFSEEDVVSIVHDAHLVNGLKYFQTQEFYQTLRPLLKLTDVTESNYHWLGEGVSSRLLKSSHSNAGWIVGYAKLALAFQPEDIGSMAKSSNSYISQNDDVLEIMDESARLTARQSSLIADIMLILRQQLSMTDPNQSRYYWLDRGIECKVLKSSGELPGWQSGLIRLQLEFIAGAKQSIGENSTINSAGLDSLREVVV
jgi:hypothetical protein